MSYLLGHYDEKSLELIVPVNVGKPGRPRKISRKTKPHGLPYKALIDTGATVSCISHKVIKEVGLKSVNLATVTTASESKPAGIYLFSLAVPLIEIVGRENEFTEETAYSYQLIEGFEFYVGKHNEYDVLLGMDVISRGSLKLDPDGHFSFCL